MKPEAIKTEADYQDVLKRLEEVYDAEPGTKDGEELEVLAGLIEKYEDEHYPIETSGFGKTK
jgi:HTH-type transcriptional regulator/antitoxin HigA